MKINSFWGVLYKVIKGLGVVSLFIFSFFTSICSCGNKPCNVNDSTNVMNQDSILVEGAIKDEPVVKGVEFKTKARSQDEHVVGYAAEIITNTVVLTTKINYETGSAEMDLLYTSENKNNFGENVNPIRKTIKFYGSWKSRSIQRERISLEAYEIQVDSKSEEFKCHIILYTTENFDYAFWDMNRDPYDDFSDGRTEKATKIYDFTEITE